MEGKGHDRSGLRRPRRRDRSPLREVILLLDTHALLWWLADDPELQSNARGAIASPTNDVLVSAAVAWEISIKRALGKLDAPRDLPAALEASLLTGLPITVVDGDRAGTLPPHHRDPFDRMLVAQALRLGAVIVTRDPAFAAYGIEVLSA
jgi:PIN domain nuclease of toxin-antitoxin system